MDVTQLGADFLVSAGYKWLLGPFGTGFFWAKSSHIGIMRPGPFYWMAVAGPDQFPSLSFHDPKPAPRAKRWHSPASASPFNFHLRATAFHVQFVVVIVPELLRA